MNLITLKILIVFYKINPTGGPKNPPFLKLKTKKNYMKNTNNIGSSTDTKNEQKFKINGVEVFRFGRGFISNECDNSLYLDEVKGKKQAVLVLFAEDITTYGITNIANFAGIEWANDGERVKQFMLCLKHVISRHFNRSKKNTYYQAYNILISSYGVNSTYLPKY